MRRLRNAIVTTEAAVKLNHVNLPVADVPATRDFFEKHFGFHRIAEPTDANVVLTDNAGLVLTISNFDHVDEVTYPKWFHVGFMQDSDEKVDDIYDRLKTAGLRPGQPENMHGARTFYFNRSRRFYRRGVSPARTSAFVGTVLVISGERPD
jgi:catechol 2,3-dioxygenase-like lactoylglutathione lyase family enzyme